MGSLYWSLWKIVALVTHSCLFLNRQLFNRLAFIELIVDFMRIIVMILVGNTLMRYL